MGHYASDCPEPRKPIADRYNASKADHPSATAPPSQNTMRSANVSQANPKPPQVTFSGEHSGIGYWTAACAVLATKDPGIKFDPHYLREIVPVLPPSPDLLL
jgi:hypothetical protein